MHRSVVFCVIVWLKLFAVQSFNLAPKPNLIIREMVGDEINKIYANDKYSSYFGYTIVLREKSVIIGAPRARTAEAYREPTETGGIYKYIFDTETLKRFDFRNEMPSQTFASLQLNSTQQWFGGAMDGGSRDADPLIACAPQTKAFYSSGYLYMHGFCYWTNNTLDNGDLLQNGVTWKISPLSDKGRKNKQYTDKIPDFAFGELGFSVHITPNNEEIIIGAPGIYQWSGAAIHIDVLNRSPDYSKHDTKPFTYKGYAVASGFFERNNQQLHYVATMPRANELLGQALIYTKICGVYKQVLRLAGEQYGDLFGYAVLVEDVNGDGLDDILIGAPYHTVNGLLESGAVYMYINRGVKGQLNFKPLIIKSPFLNRGRFGTTLSSLGDVNRDGYKDVAIGAPFADGGGAVAIYFGSSTGLADQPRQILNVSDQFADGMFGHGLSKGVDIDANGFNDLAIGAPNADTVFVYHAYPVVKVVATIRPLRHLIPTTASNLQYEICYSILTNSTKDQNREILLDLIVDAKAKRVKILSFKNNETFIASRHPKCTTYNDLLIFDFRYEFVPIVLKLSFRLKYDAKVWSGSKFCKKCAITDPLWPSSTEASIQYMHNSVDLQLGSENVPSKVILGATQILPIKYVITNVGQEAYNTLLTVKSSINVPFAKLPPECVGEFDIEWRVVCSVAKRRAFIGSAEVEVSFDLSNAVSVTDMDITAFVSSTGEEQTPENNHLSNAVKLITTAEIWIVETSSNYILAIANEEQNISISTTFEIQNNGPSTLNLFHLITEFPIGYIGDKGVDQYFVSNISAQLHIKNFVNPPLVFETSPPLSPLTLNSTEILSNNQLNENRTILLSCQSTEESNVKMLCALNDLSLSCGLQPGQNITLELSYDVQWGNVQDLMANNAEYLAHVTMVNLKPSSEVNGLLSINRHFKGAILVKINKQKTWWIYLLAIIGGLLLLVITTWLLKRRGFFKRLTKEQMEQNFKERQEKARMKEELDECTAEMTENVSVYDDDL